MMSTVTPIREQSSWNIESLYRLHTQYHADVVEGIPGYYYQQQSAISPLVAVGNYQLDEQTGKKTGCVYLYEHKQTDNNNTSTSTHTLHQHAQANTSAIFDMRWSYQPIEQQTLLASADAQGQVSLYT